MARVLRIRQEFGPPCSLLVAFSFSTPAPPSFLDTWESVFLSFCRRKDRLRIQMIVIPKDTEFLIT